jgi:N,N'-diacetyllegionaminate synthase
MEELFSMLDERVVIVAEIGINHNGELARAKQLIAAAADCGVDGVKFQGFRAEHLLSRLHPGFAHTESDVYAQLRALQVQDDWWGELHAEARKNNLLFSASFFDSESLQALAPVGVDFVKVASSEIDHFQLLAEETSLSDSFVISTGMAYLDEITSCVRFLNERGIKKIILLECTTSYPAPPESIRLGNIGFLHATFGLPAGFSDHALGIHHSLAAVASGARFIEKHFTLDCHAPGPDHSLSADVPAMRELVSGIRSIEKSLPGNSKRTISAAEERERQMGRRSVVARFDLPAGTVFSPENTALKRPGLGISPREAHFLYGRRARQPVLADQWITWEMTE